MPTPSSGPISCSSSEWILTRNEKCQDPCPQRRCSKAPLPPADAEGIVASRSGPAPCAGAVAQDLQFPVRRAPAPVRGSSSATAPQRQIREWLLRPVPSATPRRDWYLGNHRQVEQCGDLRASGEHGHRRRTMSTVEGIGQHRDRSRPAARLSYSHSDPAGNQVPQVLRGGGHHCHRRPCHQAHAGQQPATDTIRKHPHGHPGSTHEHGVDKSHEGAQLRV